MMKAAACMAVAALSAGLGGCAAAPAAGPTRGVSPELAGRIDAALQRGTGYLLAHQNADGSWGTAGRTKDLNIYAPAPGAHHVFRVSVTSLCVAALIEAGGERADPNVAAAIDRAEGFLFAELPELRRPEPRSVYNVWGHAYGIEALARMYARRPGDEARRRLLRELMAQQVQFLRTFESLRGGWGYIDYLEKTKRPTPVNVSSTTATCLVALREAQSLGVHVPAELVARGKEALYRMQNPDFTYIYSELMYFYRGKLINRAPGSLARSQGCNLALRLWGDGRITDAVLEEWLDRLWDRNGWLSRARKMPIPHESWWGVAGYFYYWGHYYAAMCVEQLPPARRARHQARLAEILIPLQETDGSWWDYPMYDYHYAWGTAMAMMALHRCRN